MSHELDYRGRNPRDADEDVEHVRWAIFVAIVSLPTWLAASLFILNAYYWASLPYTLRFVNEPVPPASIGNIAGGLMFLVVLIVGGALGLTSFILSLNILKGSSDRTPAIAFALGWFGFLALPAAGAALIAMRALTRMNWPPM